MKLKVCGYFVTQHPQYNKVLHAQKRPKETRTPTKDGAGSAGSVVDITSLTDPYKLYPVWGGLVVKLVGYEAYGAVPSHDSLLCSGDSTIVRTDNTVSWDGGTTRHLTLDYKIERCAATRCRVVCVTPEQSVWEITPYSKPKEFVMEYPLPLRVTALALGAQFTLALGNCGIVWSWGINNHGQLGQGHIETVTDPTPIDCLGGLQVRDIAAGYWHSIAVTDCDVAYSWGWNSKGQLALPEDDQMECVPTTLFHDDTEIIVVSCGHSHTAFLNSDSDLYVCGWNKYGQCGDDTSRAPVYFNNMLPSSAVASNVTHVECGPWSTYFVTSG